MLVTQKLFLDDGTELRQCPPDFIGGKILYCSRDGRFFSYRLIRGEHVLRELKYDFSPSHRRNNWRSSNGIYGSQYPRMRAFNSKSCHSIIAITWIGPRPEGMEVDHINGDKMNWSADNLEYVTTAENRRRARILSAIRSCGNDTKLIPIPRLKEIFKKYDIMDNPSDIMDLELSRHMEC